MLAPRALVTSFGTALFGGLLLPLSALTLVGCDEAKTLPGGTTDTGAATTVADTSTGTGTTEDASTSTGTTEDASTSTGTTEDASTSTGTTEDASTSTTEDTSTSTGTTEDTSTSTTEDAATTEDADTSADADAGIVLPTTPPPIVATSAVSIGDWDMTSGQEVTRCVVKRLDNADELWVSRIRTQLAKGSHHMIIYKSAETEERTTPFNCDPFLQTLQGETFPLMITQIREETLAFPNGVAFKFEPHQMVRLEAHYLNYFPTTITAHGDVYFDGIAASDVVSEANLIFYGTPDIDIPKDASVTTPWYYLEVFPGAHLFALTGHEHAYGTNVEITYSNDVDDTGVSLYPPEGEPFDWQEPPVATFDPALVFGAGEGEKSGLRYRCSWTNTSGHHVGFGESAKAEMCFLWGYYYPSQGYRLCLSPGDLYGGALGDSVCCGGPDESPFCDYVRQWAASQ